MRKIALLIFLTVSAVQTFAQEKPGVINGTVSDPLGAIVAGANVTLALKEDTTTKIVRRTTTSSEGKYSFSDVLIGAYEISVRSTWIRKDFRKLVNITSAKPVQINFIISFEACSNEEESINTVKLTDIDRAEIVRELFNLSFETPDHKTNANNDKIILSNDNFALAWLTTDQGARIIVETRQAIQDRTEKTGELHYFTFSKMTQRGHCVGVSMLDDWTVKGQFEDANMAGGGTTYEFRKVDGRWTGKIVFAWIS